MRYHFTAADNIAVGRIEARDDRARIEAAARRGERSQADEVIARLADGYDQMIGKRFRNGVELSGGEWQKIAIARAYMRDAQLLILDEPTAALDARAEFEVFQRFKELSDGKTAVLISHRFSSVRMADRIVVMARTAPSKPQARTTSCWRRAGATPSSSSCRRRGIGNGWRWGRRWGQSCNNPMLSGQGPGGRRQRGGRGAALTPAIVVDRRHSRLPPSRRAAGERSRCSAPC